MKWEAEAKAQHQHADQTAPELSSVITGICNFSGDNGRYVKAKKGACMQLIQDLIDELRKSDSPIENALIHAQVLAHKLGDKEMAAWVAAELNGYEYTASVPPYREVRLQVVGTVTNGHWVHQDQPIILSTLTPEAREALTLRKTVEGVSAIQEWAAREAEKKNLAIQVSAQRCAQLSKAYREGYYVHTAHAVPGLGVFRQILTQIRSRLLTFALNLQDHVPAEASADHIKTNLGANTVNDIFRGAVFGDNATVIVGTSNAVRGVTNNVVRNDFSSLANSMQRLGVQDDDIEELRAAIDADEGSPDHDNEAFGKRVRGWIGGMASKAGTKAWETVAATGVTGLYAALKAHYGWP
jgi:hypothetical protein